MYQFRLVNGDFAPGPGGYESVSGADRLRQDLSALVREGLNTDRFHPGWGTVVTDYLGGIYDEETFFLVQAEVSRVLQNYIVMQSEQIERDAADGIRNRFATSEIVSSIGNIDIQQQEERLVVKVDVSTVNGSQLSIIHAVGGEE